MGTNIGLLSNLSVGSASRTVLHKLLLEAIALTEKSGFFVDAVMTDGASWNRSMWNTFGVTAKKAVYVILVAIKEGCCFYPIFRTR